MGDVERESLYQREQQEGAPMIENEKKQESVDKSQLVAAEMETLLKTVVDDLERSLEEIKIVLESQENDYYGKRRRVSVASTFVLQALCSMMKWRGMSNVKSIAEDSHPAE